MSKITEKRTRNDKASEFASESEGESEWKRFADQASSPSPVEVIGLAYVGYTYGNCLATVLLVLRVDGIGKENFQFNLHTTKFTEGFFVDENTHAGCESAPYLDYGAAVAEN